MKRTILMVVILLSLPLAASAQGFKDLDAAMAGLARGFARGESRAILSGMAESDKAELNFPGLVEKKGFFGKDQAAYLLDELFQKAKPANFEQTNFKKISAEKICNISGTWTIQPSGTAEQRELYITLQNNKEDLWTIVSIKSAGR